MALALGGIHALVDAAGGFIVFRDVVPWADARADVITAVLIYNTLAFAGQVPAGWLVDRLRAYRAATAAGVALAAAALFLSPWHLPTGIVLVATGNAFFHVGAGGRVLACSGDRATESGVFVGPGAVGLCAGIWLGGHDVPARFLLAGLLLGASPLLTRVAAAPTPEAPSLPRVPRAALVVALACAACLLASVVVRALVGGTVTGAWRGVSTDVLVLLAVAACAGKVLGGFAGDRFGWLPASVVALLVSAPLVSVLVRFPAGAVAGMLVFQMTMPVTLKAVHHLLPGRPALAFGIPCLALLLGTLPALLGWHLVEGWPLVLAMVLVSAALVALGLRLLARAGASAGPTPRAGS